MRRVGGRQALFAGAALAASLYIALTATSLGDYPGDGGPAMTALLHGDLHAFAAAKPAMGVFALLIRLPFAALAYLGSPTELSIYRLGTFPCVASVGLLGVWFAGIARSRGTGLPGQIVIVAVAVFDPFVESAVQYGHPEELLTASLAIGAVVAAAQQRELLTVGLLGLALASKQWAVIAVFPVLAILAAHRLRTLASAAGIAIVVSLPAFVGSPGAFVASHLALVHEHYLEPSVYSWLFPLAPQVTVHLPGGLVHHGARLAPGLVGLLHPLIIGVAVAIAVGLARLARRGLTVDQIFAAAGLVFLLRCTLDTETMPYYHAPLLVTLLAWDVLRGDRLPLRALAAAAVGYVVFDRLTLYVVSADTAAWLYCAFALAGVALLADSLGWRHHPVPRSRQHARIRWISES